MIKKRSLLIFDEFDSLYNPLNSDLNLESVHKKLVSNFGKFLLNYVQDQNKQENNCFDFKSQLPWGDRATITSGDWTGVGTKQNGMMWDYQTCSFLVETIGK